MLMALFIFLHFLESKRTNKLADRVTSSNGTSKDGIKYQLGSRLNASLVFMSNFYLVFLAVFGDCACDINWLFHSLSYCIVICLLIFNRLATCYNYFSLLLTCIGYFDVIFQYRIGKRSKCWCSEWSDCWNVFTSLYK